MMRMTTRHLTPEAAYCLDSSRELGEITGFEWYLYGWVGADWYQWLLDCWGRGGMGDSSIQLIIDDTFNQILRASDIQQHFDDWCVSFVDVTDGHPSTLDPTIQRAMWRLKRHVLNCNGDTPNLIPILQQDRPLSKLRVIEHLAMGRRSFSQNRTDRTVREILLECKRAIVKGVANKHTKCYPRRLFSMRNGAKKSINRTIKLFDRLSRVNDLKAFLRDGKMVVCANGWQLHLINDHRIVDHTATMKGKVQVELHHDNVDGMIAKLCVSFDQAPVLDQLLSFMLTVECGDIDELLDIANYFNVQTHKVQMLNELGVCLPSKLQVRLVKTPSTPYGDVLDAIDRVIGDASPILNTVSARQDREITQLTTHSESILDACHFVRDMFNLSLMDIPHMLASLCGLEDLPHATLKSFNVPHEILMLTE